MTTRQLRIPFGPLRNSNLFSNHWLEHRLTLEPEWTECRPFAVRLLGQLAELWRQQKNRVDQYTEPNLEEAFIQPVFKKLGWTLLYQTFLRGRKPDYSLFFAEQDLDRALLEDRKSPAFWSHAAIVADAKAWTVNLDRPAIINNQREYPPEQIEWYIHQSQKNYGILTNGKLWRLYPRDLSAHQPRFNTYFECDLESLLERWTTAGDDRKQRTIDEDEEIVDDFLTFYLLFSPAGFISIETRKPLVQRAVEGSNEYRLGIGEGLKDRVFEALRICMEGFLSHEPNNLNPQADLCRCKGQSLVLLYRLLFIMYAEDRELLPFRSNRLYRENRSLGRFLEQVSEKLDRIEQGNEQDYDQTTQDLWDALSSLFDLIDRGGKQYGVPAYNGGLFDPEENGFLKDKVLSDWYLARVLDQLGRATDAEHPDAGLFRVDYRDLSIQHLGHVYEGLLELQPHWAQEPMVVIRKINHQKTHKQVIPASQNIPKGYDYTGTRYETGKVFLVPDKGERRATGSYYTPNYIVDYIVSQTLGPLCKEISDKLEQDIKQTESERKNARGRNRQLLNDKLQKLRSDFDNRVLRLKVLDPAMGSGHFLLRACQYLAEEIATNPNTSNPEADRLLADESLLTFWKRRVVEHCLYGVDINPLAVELAKVALWLETAAVGQPLAFLDHHLRCGNSLIGGRVADLGSLPGVEPLPLFEQQASYVLPSVLEGFKAIAGKPSDTRDDVKVKTQIYNQTIDRVLKPFVTIADLWCSTFFLDKTNQITPDQYQQALQTLSTSTKYRTLLKSNWFKNAIEKARQPDVACFHWELEFPDIFFDLTGRRQEAGFDAVIGNPPYRKERDSKDLLTNLRMSSYGKKYYTGKMDFWYFFLHRAIDLTKSNGFISFISPSYWLKSTGSSKLVEHVKHECSFVDAVDFGKNMVFENVGGHHMTFVLLKNTAYQHLTYQHYTSKRLSQSEISRTLFEKSQDHSVLLSLNNRKIYMPDNKIDFEGSIHTNLLEKLAISSILLEGPDKIFLVSQGIVEAPDVVSPAMAEKANKPALAGRGVFVLSPDELSAYAFNENEKKFLKPYLRASQVSKYHHYFAGHYVFYIGNTDNQHIANNRNLYLNIIHHLNQFKQIITSSNAPYGIHRTREARYFTSEKLLCPNMFDKPCFTYSPEECYVNFAFNVVIAGKSLYSLKYLLGILNSSIGTYWFNISGKKRGVNNDIGVGVMRRFPVCTIDFSNPDEKSKHDKMVQLVEQMLDLHKQLAATKIPDEKTKIQRLISATDSAIDNLVYQLYGLTPEEIAIVEGRGR